MKLTDGEKLRLYRLRAGMTLKDMAQAHMCSISGPVRWEAGTYPAPADRMRIVRAELRERRPTVGEIAGVIRRRRGITLPTAAEAVGLAASTLRAIEAGKLTSGPAVSAYRRWVEGGR